MSNSDIEKEFEDFVYIVSHDMAAPQRHIREFTKLLLSSFDVPLNDDQKMYCQFIEAGLIRIEAMQAALLNFSRVTSQGEVFQKFDGVACIDRVLQKLSHRIKDTEAAIEVPLVPFSVLGDESQIEAVFSHLIENSLIYKADEPPFIKVSAEQRKGRVFFSVTDNGIGIADGRDEHIFTMFRRLHAADAYGGGVGAGLAIARKIIRRHGGELTYASGGNQGSVFEFSLPLA